MRNPCPVVDQNTGIIWLLLTHNLGIDKESQIVDGTSEGSRTVWVTHSADDGVTWAAPKEITDTTKRKNWSWYATGPGVGIQLRRPPFQNRLVIPCDNKTLGDTIGSHSHVIYSDDGGKTWKLGGVTEDGVNECQVAERSDGIAAAQHAPRQWESSENARDFYKLRWRDELVQPDV